MSALAIWFIQQKSLLFRWTHFDNFCLDVAFPESLSHLQKDVKAFAGLSARCGYGRSRFFPSRVPSNQPRWKRSFDEIRWRQSWCVCHLGDLKNLITWSTWSTWQGFTREYPGQRGDCETASTAVVKLGICFWEYNMLHILWVLEPMADSFDLMPTCICRRDSFSLNLLRMKIPRHELLPFLFEFQQTRFRSAGHRGFLDVEVVEVIKLSNQTIQTVKPWTGPCTALLGLRHGCFDESRGTEHRFQR